MTKEEIATWVEILIMCQLKGTKGLNPEQKAILDNASEDYLDEVIASLNLKSWESFRDKYDY